MITITPYGKGVTTQGCFDGEGMHYSLYKGKPYKKAWAFYLILFSLKRIIFFLFKDQGKNPNEVCFGVFHGQYNRALT